MKTTAPTFPPGVAEAWFQVHCGGEVWNSHICRGAELPKILTELTGDFDEGYAAQLADADNWYVLDGVCRHISLPCGEDPDIEITSIDDQLVTGMLAREASLRAGIQEMRTALEFYGNADNYRLSDYPNGSRPIWDDYGAKARDALAPSENENTMSGATFDSTQRLADEVRHEAQASTVSLAPNKYVRVIAPGIDITAKLTAKQVTKLVQYALELVTPPSSAVGPG